MFVGIKSKTNYQVAKIMVASCSLSELTQHKNSHGDFNHFDIQIQSREMFSFNNHWADFCEDETCEKLLTQYILWSIRHIESINIVIDITNSSIIFILVAMCSRHS